MAPPPIPASHPYEIGDVTERMKKSVGDRAYTRHLESQEKKNVMLPWLKIVEVTEAAKLSETTARASFRFPVQHEYLNPAMGLHGGQAAAMFDIATTWTLEPIRKTGFWMHFGTTRTLNLTYMRPAAEGEMLRLESEIVHAGKRLCLIKAVLLRERDRAIISTCEHQKYNTDADMPKV